MIEAVSIWSVVAVVLLAVLVGVAIPTLLQLRATLKAAHGVLDRSGKTLAELETAARQARSLGKSMEETVSDVRKVSATLAGLAESANDLRRSIRSTAAVAAAVAPAVAAAVNALIPAEPKPGKSGAGDLPGTERQDADPSPGAGDPNP